MVYVNEIRDINDMPTKGLNPATPAQPEKVEQETPFIDEGEAVETAKVEKPKRSRKKNKENE